MIDGDKVHLNHPPRCQHGSLRYSANVLGPPKNFPIEVKRNQRVQQLSLLVAQILAPERLA
jgi:hypothetical protein